MYSKGIELKGGGVIGMMLASPIMLFGAVGSKIIILLITFVFIMLMGNIALVDFLKFVTNPFRKMGEYAKEQREISRQDAQYIEKLRDSQIQERRKKEFELNIEKDFERELEKASEKSVSFPELPEEWTDPPLKPPSYIPPNDDGYDDDPPFDIPPEDLQEPELDLESVPEPEKEQRGFDSIQVAFESYQEEKELEENLLKQREASLVEYQQMYSLPGIELLDNIVKKRPESDIKAELETNSEKLVETLKSFGVMTKIVGIVRGPSVTRYEIQPAPGVKISKITSLTDDIALNLAAAGVRMEAPIPGKSAVGVEVPNSTVDTVAFRELLDSEDFREAGSNLRAAIGKAISGEIIISDIAKMPHLLIAGTTGSGKSVCVNSIVMSILYRATPEEVRLMMIDPKSVEFMMYSGIPHLLTPVVTDPKKAAGALGWAVNEMTQRYSLFAENNVRDIGGYNEIAKDSDLLEVMPKIVIFIDELADLMMTAAKEVESNICRLAQMARAAGIHLVIATQRPSVNVVTGPIKANIPSRIGLKVASQVDARVIFDTAGAEKLLGKGDMLYSPVGIPKPIRVQGCWVSEKEIERVAAFIKSSFELSYDENVIEEIERQALAVAEKDNAPGDTGEEFELDDEKLEDAIEAVIDAGKASTSYLQLKLKLGYGRAARLIEMMEKMGVVGKFEGSRPREVLMTKQDWLERKLRQQ
jgi:S-DNA-T family DNA segregation ATPase FtsK/SpoIIIE